MRFAACLLATIVSLVCRAAAAQPARPSDAAIDAHVAAAMQATGARGLALAVVEDGRPTLIRAYGVRNAAGDPLTPQTIMYGASLTKTVFAYTMMQLVEAGVLDLDAPIARYLDRPLPEYAVNENAYGPWGHLAGDERWRRITPRILLTHSVGFANFHWDEPDQRLRLRFEPGARYAYSGVGLMLLQFTLEQGRPGLRVGEEIDRRVFSRLGMRNSSLQWRLAFATNLADGFRADGTVEPHDERSRVRVAGSMDTTIEDMAAFAAGLIRGEGLSPAGLTEMTRPQLPITTATQFPSMQPEAPPERRRADLAAGLGVIVFDGPQGRGFYKGGHNDSTGNTLVCVHRGRRCVVILANDVRAEAAFPELVRFILGETDAPWSWEYGQTTFWSPSAR